MRERIAGAFVLLAVVLIVLVVTVRAWTVSDLVDDQEQIHQQQTVDLMGQVVDDRAAAGKPVGKRLLTTLVDVQSRVVLTPSDGPTVEAAGAAYDAVADHVEVTTETEAGTLVLTSASQRSAEVSARQLTSLIMLALLVAILAGLAGWWLASRLSAPFQALSGAAAALGRGRFDLHVPETRIPEAHAIGQALKVSAAQLEGRLARERDFAEYASHELRTPLTALQLELEDLTLRDDVPDDAKAAAERCMRRVDDVNHAAGHLVSITRQGALVEGGQVPLSLLATTITQAWADRLGEERRTVTARADGDLDVTFTPGPVEHVLEQVLDEVVGGDGPVRLRFVGSEDHLRVHVPGGVASIAPHPGVTSARDLAEAQGGRVTGDLVEAGLDILMPRR